MTAQVPIMGALSAAEARAPYMIIAGIPQAVADALYLRKNGPQIAATDFLALGAAPPASGAIRIDAASYGGATGTVLSALNSGKTLILQLTDAGNAIVAAGANTLLSLHANGAVKWRVMDDPAGTGTFASQQATTRIVGGSVNGLSTRNSANTRDNFRVYDSGAQFDLANGTNILSAIVAGAAGERTAGGFLSVDGDIWLSASNAGTAGRKAGIAYFDGVTWRSAAEIPNTAAGFGTFALMKSGGAAVIGTDPGGTEPLRVGGTIKTNGNIYCGTVGNLGSASRGFITFQSDGVWTLFNNSATDFTRLQFGGTSNAFPSLKRSSTTLVARLADDSADTFLQARNVFLTNSAVSGGAGVVSFGTATQNTVGAAGGASALPATPSGYLRFYIGATEYVLPFYAQA